jgi:hypothetical protein
MRFPGFFTLALPLSAAALAFFACGGSGSLKAPTSDSQSDDPCDPGSGGSGVLPAPVDGGGMLIALPDGAPGIGFEDLGSSGTLGRLLVPAGRTGNFVLIDPSIEALEPVSGFGSAPTYDGKSDVGAISADEGNGIVYVVDATNKQLDVVDAKQLSIVASVATASTPGFVRYVAQTNEVWFTVGMTETTAPAHASFIAVAGGPESLVVDANNKRVFTHSTASTTFRIDPASHAVSASWPNGCVSSRGIAVDSARGWVISACEEGHVVVLDGQNGATVATVAVAGGVDQIAYDAQRMRLYVPSTSAAAMSVVALSTSAPAAVLGSIATSSDAHCVVTNGGGAVYVCSPAKGGLLAVRDPF